MAKLLPFTPREHSRLFQFLKDRLHLDMFGGRIIFVRGFWVGEGRNAVEITPEIARDLMALLPPKVEKPKAPTQKKKEDVPLL